MLNDWLKKLVPLNNLTEVKPKPDMHKISYVSCQLYLFALSIDWFIGLCVSFVIGQNN